MLNKIKNSLVDLSHECGHIMTKARKSRDFQRFEKTDNSLVTSIDLQLQKLLDEKLRQLIPESRVIGEESFSRDEIETMPHTPYVWIVDPIDGTLSFADPDSNEYGLGIALLRDGHPILSIFFAPELDLDGSGESFFMASEGKDGCYLNNHLVRARAVQNKQNLERYMLLGERHPAAAFESSLGEKTLISKSDRNIASLARLAHLASSNTHNTYYDFIIFRNAKIWDILAGAYLIEKAGGSVFLSSGDPIFPFDFSSLDFSDNHPRLPTSLCLPHINFDPIEAFFSV